MARAPDPRQEEAKKLYIQGMKLVDIAHKLNVPAGTVRRWKHTYEWDGERSPLLSERSAKKENIKKRSDYQKNKQTKKEIKSVMENPDLTEKQKLFCLHYIRCFNATKAYQRAYESNYSTANSEGYKLLVNPSIKIEIERIKQERLNREFFSESDIFQKYMDIAFADITDYVEFGTKEITMSNDNGLEAKIDISYVNINPSNTVDGTLITEISQGKDGIKLKIADRMKALQWLADHMDMATEEQRARIAMIKKKAEENDKEEDNTGVVLLSEVLPETDEGIVEGGEENS